MAFYVLMIYVIYICQSQLITQPTIINDAHIANLVLDIELKKVGQLFISVYDKSRKAYFPRGTGNKVFKAIGPIGFSNPNRNVKTVKRVIIKGLVMNNNYAISLFHDLNSNYKFDTKWNGIPKDGYGASYQNGKTNWWQQPTWIDCRFKLTADMASKPYKMNVIYAP